MSFFNSALYCLLGYDIFVQWKIDTANYYMARCESRIKTSKRVIQRLYEEEPESDLETTQIMRKIEIHEGSMREMQQSVLELTKLKCELVRIMTIAGRAEEMEEISELLTSIAERYSNVSADDVRDAADDMTAVGENMSLVENVSEPDADLVAKFNQSKQQKLVELLADAPTHAVRREPELIYEFVNN